MPEGGRRVYVGNLAYKTSSTDLREHFRSVGEVTHAEIYTDRSGRIAPTVSGRPVSKGCGIVEFADAECAEKAIKTLCDTTLDGRLIFVREDRDGENPRAAIPPNPDGSRPGDWVCGRCGDLQFARNTQCRKCGEPKSGNRRGGRSRSRSGRSRSWRSRSRSGGRGRSPALGGPGGSRFMPGDWACPKCGDHQFARNAQCRQCGEERPRHASTGGDGLRQRASSSGSRSRHGRRRRVRVRRERKRKASGKHGGRRKQRRYGRKEAKDAGRGKHRRRTRKKTKRKEDTDGSDGSSSAGDGCSESASSEGGSVEGPEKRKAKGGSRAPAGGGAEKEKSSAIIAEAQRELDEVEGRLSGLLEGLQRAEAEEEAAARAAEAQLSAARAASDASLAEGLRRLEDLNMAELAARIQDVKAEFAETLRKAQQRFEEEHEAEFRKREAELQARGGRQAGADDDVARSARRAGAVADARAARERIEADLGDARAAHAAALERLRRAERAAGADAPGGQDDASSSYSADYSSDG